MAANTQLTLKTYLGTTFHPEREYVDRSRYGNSFGSGSAFYLLAEQLKRRTGRMS